MKLWQGLLITALSVCVLPACTPLAKNSLNTLRIAAMGVSLPTEASLPQDTAYMRVRTSQAQAVIGRGDVDAGIETWYTADAQVLAFSQGLLTYSVGLPDALIKSVTLGDTLHKPLARLSLPQQYTRRIDLPGHFNELTTYQLIDDGVETLTVWERQVNTRRLQESVLSSNARQPMPGNTYWLAQDSGALVQSLQWLSPNFPLLLQPTQVSPAVKPSPTVLPVVVAANSLQHTLVAVRPTRLSDLLLEYPLPQGSWPLGAAWLSREQQAKQRELKMGVLYDLDQALADKADKKLTAAVRLRLQAFREELAAQPVTGRKPLPALHPRWLQENSKANPLLNGGDRLVRWLAVPTTARVLGNVPAPCAVTVEPDMTVLSVLEHCLAGEALPDYAYLVTPEGRVQTVAVATWNREAPVGIMPGASIVVPFSLNGELAGNTKATEAIAQWLATQVMP